jgi:tRNA-splicing ligase RtcB
MKKVIFHNQENEVPAKLWLDNIEESALAQITNLQNLPFAFKHIAIMPDCHTGYGMPIGGVLATHQVIIPNAVGVDIGCGMCAIKTSLKSEQLDKNILTKIIDKIREIIPVGFNHHKKDQDRNLMPITANKNYPIIVGKEYSSALRQLGTLGGGNHFIEIQKDTDNNVWIMIHSGSRNLGYKVAKHYNEVAISLNEKWFSSVPKKWELAFLPIETQEAKNYMTEMQYCVDFALANRKLMMDRIIDCFNQMIFNTKNNTFEKYFQENFENKNIANTNEMINIAHNYARFENHFGENVIVHRKGATSARKEEIGIIPGSQGTKSYIVKGLGNPESFMSCSHGAGRKMGRSQAIKTLNLENEIKKLNDQNIVHGIRTAKDLDEASGAYKDIDVVMANQIDLVEIITELTPLAVIKG